MNGGKRKQTRKLKSLRSVGIQARGRSTILRINYRNTKEILATAIRYEGNKQQGAIRGENSDIPLLTPIPCERRGAEARITVEPHLPRLMEKLTDSLITERKNGFQWGDMAVLLRSKHQITMFCKVLAQRKIPHGSSKALVTLCTDIVKVMTIHSAKGLEFPVVAVAGFVSKGNREEQQLFYVGCTRATERLTVGIRNKNMLNSGLTRWNFNSSSVC